MHSLVTNLGDIPGEAPLPASPRTAENTHRHVEFVDRLKGLGLDDETVRDIDWGYDLAKVGHKDQVRQDGDRFFEHARDVTIILLDAGVRDRSVLIASTTHDTGEDTPMWGSVVIYGPEGVRKELMRRYSKAFGADVGELVLAVTKYHKTGDPAHDRINLERYFRELEKAPFGAILVKMADRLHNLRSVEAKSIDKQLEQYLETRDILLPLFESRVAAEVPASEPAKLILTWLREEFATLKKRLSESTLSQSVVLSEGP